MSEAEQTSEPQQTGGVSERTARVILFAVAMLTMWGIVAALPEVAYVIVGILLCLGWQKARAQWQRRRSDEDGPEKPGQDGPGPDVATVLRRLLGDDRGVLLTRLRDDLNTPDTKTVRTLLDKAGIRVRAGVRTTSGNGPGVHRDDIPPTPLAEDIPQEGGCCCRSNANTNTDNGEDDASREGLRVEHIGASGHIVHHPADNGRHHVTTR